MWNVFEVITILDHLWLQELFIYKKSFIRLYW